MASAFSSGKRTGRVNKALLASRGYIDRLDAGLSSTQGAQEIIELISSQRTVTKLILGQNELGDDGCVVLFRFLSSAAGRKYPISEISLNTTGIGDAGLLAVGDYLKDNTSLKELFLQNNLLTGSRNVIQRFVSLLDHSQLEILALSTNLALRDEFASAFFPIVQLHSLREIHISAVGLTPLSAPYIVDFLTSDRCRLLTFKCNGNSLGYEGLSAIVKAIERGNYSLLEAEFFANINPPRDATPGAIQANWAETESRLRLALKRNAKLRTCVHRDALQLLRYARPLLYRQPTWSSNLPTELQFHILSFLAPSLSERQLINIFNYASSPSTLPSASLGTRSSDCVTDPESMPVNFKVWEVHDRPGGGCGACSGSLVCHKEKVRQRWLDTMNCSFWSPGTEPDPRRVPARD